MHSNNLKNAVVVITGGTGSFGNVMTRSLLAEGVSEIRVFSRDENKQDLMRNDMQDERLRFHIGDVRDSKSVRKVVSGSDYVFHAAALKQVPSCEFFPLEANATNVLGSSNVIEAAIECQVKSIVCLSTDKAVYPINAMGMSKALMEKVAMSFSRQDHDTRICITRYGNVMMSRGSAIPLFLNQINSSKEVTITNPAMTRFLMSLDDSVELVKYAFTKGESGDLFVKKAPGASVENLVQALVNISPNSEGVKVRNIGIRHGEKLDESLLSSEERIKALDLGEYFRVPLDSRTLDYQIYFDKGDKSLDWQEPYTSRNTKQLSIEEIQNLLENLPEYKSFRKEHTR
jgi:UDP-N-acetylglucosamine 4,6-dehydratase